MNPPPENEVIDFMGITGCDNHDAATKFLKGAGNLETAINHYFDNPNRYDGQNDTWDQDAFSTDRNGEKSTGPPAFLIESFDESSAFAHSSAPTRPPSRRDSMVVHGSPQENGIIGDVSHTSTSNFGPANQPFYEQTRWAVTTVNPGFNETSVADVVPDVEVPERVRINNEPVFMKPLGVDPLPALITSLSNIPLAKKILLESGPQLEDYNPSPDWWHGSAIPPQNTRPEIGWELSDEQVAEVKRIHKVQDDSELIYETQRLMAFMDSSERLYGSVEPLSQLHAILNADSLPELKVSEITPLDQVDRFAAAWSSAISTYSGPESALFRINFEAGDHAFLAYCLDIQLSSTLTGSTLYDHIDNMLWYDHGNWQEESTETSGSTDTETCLSKAPPVLIIRLRPAYSGTGSSGIDVPTHLYLDRYMSDNKSAAKQMRLEMDEVRNKLKSIDARIDDVGMASGSRDFATSEWIEAEGEIASSVELLDRTAAYLEKEEEKLSEDEEDQSSLVILPEEEMEGLDLNLETNIETSRALSRYLKQLRVDIQAKLDALKGQRDDLYKELTKIGASFKGPHTRSWLDFSTTDEEGDTNVETETHQQQLKYKYILRGASTHPRNVILKYGTEDDWPQYHQISWDHDPAINRTYDATITRRVITEETLLETIKTESRTSLLVYASEVACQPQDIRVSDALIDFVHRDNLNFKIERGQIGNAYDMELTNLNYGSGQQPSPPNSDIELSDTQNHGGYQQAAVDDHDDPPPYSPSAAAAAATAALQADREKEMYVNMHRKGGLQGTQYRGSRLDPGLHPITGDADDEEYEDIDADEAAGVLRVPTLPVGGGNIREGEVQEIHVNDLSSSGGEGDAMMAGSEQDPPALPKRPATPAKLVTTALAAAASPGGATIGVKRSLEE